MKIRWDIDQCKKILNQYRSGVSIDDLSRSIGLCKNSIRRGLKKAERIENTSDPFKLLSVRSQNFLRAANLLTPFQIREAIKDGRFKNSPNFGKLSQKEVLKWLEMFL